MSNMNNTTSRRLYRISAALCAFSLIGLGAARAQNKPASTQAAAPAVHVSKAERKLLKTKDRLKLSDEQWTKVEPVLAEREKRHKALLKDVRDASPRPSASEIDQKTRQIETDIEAKLAPLLSAEQLAEYKQMREQAVKQMDAYEERREQQQSSGGKTNSGEGRKS
jgi:hypothetical protein